MSSDYIPRLRIELLRAGAAEHARLPVRRTVRRLRPLAVAAAVALLVAAVVLALPNGRQDERPATQQTRVTYRVDDPAMTEQAATIVRARLNAAGIDAEVSADNGTVAISARTGADVAALLRPGSFAIYDWEAAVLGPDGAPAPADTSVTGGDDAGHAGALTEAEARARAETRPGARVVRGASGWFVLGGAPRITNAAIATSRPGVEPSVKEPIVSVGLTPAGDHAFTSLTRTLAHRGAAQAVRQHLAIVIDDRIVSVPYIDYREAPDGVDGSRVQIAGGLTPESARMTAALLSAGPLPPGR
jgi:preprotein translocase subunit SecD